MSTQPAWMHGTKNWKPVMKGVFAGLVAGVASGYGGFWLTTIPRAKVIGPGVLILVPMLSGFAIGLVTDGNNGPIAVCVLAGLISLALLIANGVETLVCVLMALPLLIIGLVVGVWLSQRLKRNTQSNSAKTAVLVAMPLLILAGHRVEMRTLVHSRVEAVSNSIWLNAEPEKVWANILSFDSLQAKKPMLMHIGLPIPERCVMSGRGVGAKRICYFDHGSIEETVIAWEPPKRMRLSIDRTNMPGRHWLEFEDAEYDLREDAGGTTLTRNTTIASNLYPAWYWRPLERWGVEDEHEYIFADVARRVGR